MEKEVTEEYKLLSVSTGDRELVLNLEGDIHITFPTSKLRLAIRARGNKIKVSADAHPNPSIIYSVSYQNQEILPRKRDDSNPS